jgi:multicomponent Na+:H+ antiporter subunit E
MLVLLLGLWIVFNGRITWEVFLTGLVLAVPVYLFFCLVMHFTPKKEWDFVSQLPWLIKYFGVLLWEIVKANVAVTKLILSDRLEPEPVLVRFKRTFKQNSHEVLLANSITLTPGTITVDLSEDDWFTIHALDREFAEGIDNSVFIQMIQEVEDAE